MVHQDASLSLSIYCQILLQRRKGQQPFHWGLAWSQELEPMDCVLKLWNSTEVKTESLHSSQTSTTFHRNIVTVQQQKPASCQPPLQNCRLSWLAEPTGKVSGKTNLSVKVSGETGSLLIFCPYRWTRVIGSCNFPEDESCLEWILLLNFNPTHQSHLAAKLAWQWGNLWGRPVRKPLITSCLSSHCKACPAGFAISDTSWGDWGWEGRNTSDENEVSRRILWFAEIVVV